VRALVAGGSGFIGSHLCDRLLQQGHEVVVVDNFVSGRAANVTHLAGHERFTLVEHDVCLPVLPALAAAGVTGRFDAVLDLASPASPTDFSRIPLEILAVGADGTRQLLDVAREHSARFLLASTSEVYGDPLVHPQPEEYWGNVDPIGPRSCYDESKRFAEAVTTAYRRVHSVDTVIVRIFNTYGPRMRPDDGRVLTNFITQALRGEALTVFGDGRQTRSFCYVTDEVDGLLAALGSGQAGPFNVGNPDEVTIVEGPTGDERAHAARSRSPARRAAATATALPRPHRTPPRVDAHSLSGSLAAMIAALAAEIPRQGGAGAPQGPHAGADGSRAAGADQWCDSTCGWPRLYFQRGRPATTPCGHVAFGTYLPAGLYSVGVTI
jgi:dTDP-glucose 4,6-dehydratase